MKHEDKNQTFDDVLRNVAKTGFPDKEAMRARILSHAEGRQANKSAYYATDNNGASDAGSQKTVTGGGNGDRMQPHRRRQRPRWQKLAAAGGLIAAALAIVLIATSLLNRPESPLDDPETTLPPVTESTTARDDESFATTGETEGRTEQTEDVTEPAETEPVESEHYIDGILVEQGMLYSSGSDLGPVSFDFPETHQMAKMEIGGHYRLSFDGLVMESYPVQIRVSKVELLDSADSEWIAEADINAAVNYLRYNLSAYLVDARESSDHETGIIPIPNSHIEEDQRETLLLPLTNMEADPEETASVLSASVTPEPGSPRAIVFVYADTQEDSVEAARLIKDAGHLLTISLGAMDDYDGDIAELPVYTSYTEYTGYLLQDDLFFARSVLRQSRYSITYIFADHLDQERQNPVYIHSSEDRVFLDELANAEFEPTSEPMGFPRYLLNLDHDGQDMEFYLDSKGVATGPLLGEGNYRISSIDADAAFNTIDRIYHSQSGRLSPGLVQITPGSFPAPDTIGGRYRVEISDVMTASNPPIAFIREAVALEDSEPDVIRELPIWIVSEYISLLDSVTLLDVRASADYEAGFIPAYNTETRNLPLAELRVSAFNVKAFVEASAAPDVALEEHLVLVYGNTSEEAAEAVRLLKEAGIPAVLSLGSIDNYDGELALPSESMTYTEYNGYLLQDDLFFAESALQQSRYNITHFEGESADSDREYPVYIHTLQDRIALDEVANAEFEPTSEPMGFPRYLLNFDHDGQDMEFYLDSKGVATGPLLGEGNYRISSIDADTAFNTIDRIYRSQSGRLSPGLVQITPGSFPAPATIGGRYRVEISDVMTASNPPLATIREAVALEDSEPDVIRELPIWIVSEHLHLFDSATLIDVRSATEYETGFIPAFKTETLNLPLATILDGSTNVKALIEAEAAPDVPLEEHLVLVYGATSGEAGEAVRALKQAGIPAVLSIGSIDNYDH